MKVAVIGASGLLGKYLVREWKGDDVAGFSSKDVDIRDAGQVNKLIERVRPDWILLAAAYTDVDGCESHQELAFQTNCTGAVNLAQAARDHGSRLLFVSTDYVFDGANSTPYETDAPRNPRSIYGKSKAEAEVHIAEILLTSCIARTSWLFGVGGKCFPDTILRLADARPELQVVNDQRGSPTYARDLALALVQLCRKNAQGIVHVTNSGDCTWFEFAFEIIRQAGLKTVVQPTTTDKIPRLAPRPKYSVLSAKSLARYEILMPAWQQALTNYLSERRQT